MAFTGPSTTGIPDGRRATEALVRDCARQLGNWHSDSFSDVWRRIGELGPCRALPILASLLSDPDPGVRAGAAEITGEIGSKEDLAVLLNLLDDELGSVRDATALAFARLASDPRTTLSALALLDKGGPSRAVAIPRRHIVIGHVRVGIYMFPTGDPDDGVEIGARLLSAARVVDVEHGSFVALFEARRDASPQRLGARLDIFDGYGSTRVRVFEQAPDMDDMCRALEDHLGRQCTNCAHFVSSEARFCQGCGSPMNRESTDVAAHAAVVELDAVAAAGPLEIAVALASNPDTPVSATAALREELAAGADLSSIDPLWAAFDAAVLPAERERLASLIAEIVTARGADSLGAALDLRRSHGRYDCGVLYRALGLLFPRAMQSQDAPFLVDARIAPGGDRVAVATKSTVIEFDGASFAATNQRAIHAQTGHSRESNGWQERPSAFSDGWLMRLYYGPSGSLAVAGVGFVAGSIERLEPSLVATVYLNPFRADRITIQTPRTLREAGPRPWALRWDGLALALSGAAGVSIHDLSRGGVAAFPTAHSAPVRFLGYSPDGQLLVTSDGFEARVWSSRTAVMLKAHDLQGRELLGFDRLGRLLAVARSYKRAMLVDVLTGADAGEVPDGDLLHLSADGVARCVPASSHRSRLARRRVADIGPRGRALFTGDDDLVYWDGVQERVLHRATLRTP